MLDIAPLVASRSAFVAFRSVCVPFSCVEICPNFVDRVRLHRADLLAELQIALLLFVAHRLRQAAGARQLVFCQPELLRHHVELPFQVGNPRICLVEFRGRCLRFLRRVILTLVQGLPLA